MGRRWLAGAAALLLAGCTGPTPSLSPSPVASLHVHPQAAAVQAALADAFGLSFEPAGPHHVLGRTDDGIQLDLVGVPVEEVVLSLPAADRQASVATGLAILPHLRDLLHGTDTLWDGVAAGLACRRDASASCPRAFAAGDLEARFTGDEREYLVLVMRLR